MVPKEGEVRDPYLRLYSNGEFIRSYRLRPGNTVIGRDPSAAIMVNDRFVSRHHFFVEYDGEQGVHIQDLRSRNGTFVNGQKVDRSELRHGDKISFGIFEVVLAYPIAAGATAPQLKEDAPETAPRLPPEAEITAPPRRPEKPADGRARRPSGLKPMAKLPPTREADLQALPYRVIPRRTLTWTAKFLLVSGTMIILSGFLAWNINQWSKLREQRLSAPAAEPAKSEDRRGPAKGAPEAPRGPSDAPAVQARERPRNANRDMMAGLNRSIDSVLQGEVDKGANLKNKSSGDTMKTARILNPDKSDSVSVEIKMPSSDAFLADEKGGNKDFDLESYQAMLRTRVVSIESCYVDHMKHNPKAGKVSISLTLKASGAVKKVGVSAPAFKSKDFDRCVVDQVQKMKMDPPPWDDFAATYTIRFEGTKMNLAG